MKKSSSIISFVCAICIVLTGAVSVASSGDSTYSIEDIKSLKNIILQNTSNTEQSYDLNGDGTSNVVDLCTMKQQYIADSSQITYGTETYRGFTVDNVLHSQDYGNVHFNVYIPDSYDGSKPYAIYFTLCGYEGLYFQGVGVNLQDEAFAFESQAYNDKMIVVAPQLNDWGEKSANQTIALVTYFLSHYNIDTSKVYANGYSGGGETMSLVMAKRPELFTAYLHCSSKWDGDYSALVQSRTPVYLVIGENDEYYGSTYTKETYETLYKLYQAEGLTDSEIDDLLVLDVKQHSYFTERGMSNEHGGGGLFAYDNDIMGWLFSH